MLQQPGVQGAIKVTKARVSRADCSSERKLEWNASQPRRSLIQRCSEMPDAFWLGSQGWSNYSVAPFSLLQQNGGFFSLHELQFCLVFYELTLPTQAFAIRAFWFAPDPVITSTWPLSCLAVFEAKFPGANIYRWELNHLGHRESSIQLNCHFQPRSTSTDPNNPGKLRS